VSATRHLIAIALVALAASCSESRPTAGSAPAGSGSVARLTATPPPGSAEHPHYRNRTTSPKIAVGNLDAQIDSLTKAIAAQPADDAARGRLISALVTRAGHLGTVSDYGRALELAEAGVANRPDDPEALVRRAEVRGALHDFTGAQEDVKAAMNAGDPKNLTGAQMSILLGLGDIDSAMEIAHAQAHRQPSIRTIGLEAIILSRLGKIEEAEQKFREAENSFQNVTPFPLVWLYFHWGSMWEDEGDLKRAEALYREGHRRLPQHAHTVAHLALLVPPAEGIALLEGVLERSDDPEYRGMLARLQETQKPGTGSANLERAKKDFGALLDKHPLAFADHAARFWMGPGLDTDKARGIARENIATRPRHPGAYELLLDALGTTAPNADDCKLLTGASELKHVKSELKTRLDAATAKCAP